MDTTLFSSHLLMLEGLSFAADGGRVGISFKKSAQASYHSSGNGEKHLLPHASTYVFSLEINYIKDRSVRTKPPKPED